MKSTILFTLLTLWIFLILAPSVTLIFDKDASVYSVMSLNEEEQQEKGEKEFEEKQVISDAHIHINFTMRYTAWDPSDVYRLHGSDHTLDIPIPPPENWV